MHNYQHSVHLQCVTSPAVSHTYPDQRPPPPPVDTWITSAEAGQLQDHSGGAQTCKHGDVLTFKASGENLTCSQPHKTMVHIEDNSHITRSVIMDDSWQLGKTMNQQDGNLNAMVGNTGGAWCPVVHIFSTCSRALATSAKKLSVELSYIPGHKQKFFLKSLENHR